MMDSGKYSIAVAGTVARKPRITEYLDELGLPYYLHLQEDTPLPDGYAQWPLDWLNWGHSVGAYRCWLSHRACFENIPRDTPALIFEDDAEPKRSWLDDAFQGLTLLDQYEVVSLHGRHIAANHDLAPLKTSRATWKVPGFRSFGHSSFRWCCGSLAYLIRPDAMDKYVAQQYQGMPVDIWLCNECTFCVIEDSPFIHPKGGSVLEAATNDRGSLG